MKLSASVLPVVLPLLLAAVPASADRFWLSGDVKLEGILTDSTTADIDVQVSQGGSITLSKEQVQRMEISSEAERAALRKRWDSAAAAQLKADAEVRAFEAGQRAKGLILYEGDWLSQPEYDRRIKQEELSLERERLELESRRIFEETADHPVSYGEPVTPAPFYYSVYPGASGLHFPALKRRSGRRTAKRAVSRPVRLGLVPSLGPGAMYINNNPPFAWTPDFTGLSHRPSGRR